MDRKFNLNNKQPNREERQSFASKVIVLSEEELKDVSGARIDPAGGSDPQ
ncbi:MAG: hypothetical protein F6K42_01110 [Leptolyngbya sp. SIO1D8]|nr:hypothetical protein [Leptolyngbya sp. SIO1D8]